MSKSLQPSYNRPERERQQKRKPSRRLKAQSFSSEAKVVEAERQKLAREVHDRIGQPLTAMKLMTDRLLISKDKNGELLEEMHTLIMEMQAEVRRLCLSLEPAPELPDSNYQDEGG